MKKILILLLTILLLTSCGTKKASTYYPDVDDAIFSFDEYLDYEESANADAIEDYDERKEEYRKIALLQADALNLVETVQNEYKGLPENEQEKLLNYIREEYSPRYDALAEWLTQPNSTYNDLIEAIKQE